MIKTKKGSLVSAIKNKVHLQLSREKPSSEDQNYESYTNTAIDYGKHTSFYDPQVSIISDSQDQPQNRLETQQEGNKVIANETDDAQEAYDDQLMNQIQREIVGQSYQPQPQTAPTIGKSLRSSKVSDVQQVQLPIRKLVPRISVLKNKPMQNQSKANSIIEPTKTKEVRFDPNPVNLFENQTAQQIDEVPRLSTGKRQKQILIQDQNEYQDYNPQPVKKINNQNSLKEMKLKKFKIKTKLLRPNIQVSKIIKVLVKKGSNSDLKFLVQLRDNNRMILPLKQLKTFYKDHLIDFLQQKAGYAQQS